MSDPRCDLTEMLVDQCSHCTGRRGHEAPPPPVVRTSMVFASRFHGVCAHCGSAYDEGALIARSDDGWCIAAHTAERA